MTKQMWILLFLENFTSVIFHLHLWLQKYNTHFLLSIIISLKSTFILFFILVPKKYLPHFVLSPFTSLKITIFYFVSKKIYVILTFCCHFSPSSRVIDFFYFGSKYFRKKIFFRIFKLKWLKTE